MEIPKEGKTQGEEDRGWHRNTLSEDLFDEKEIRNRTPEEDPSTLDSVVWQDKDNCFIESSDREI